MCMCCLVEADDASSIEFNSAVDLFYISNDIVELTWDRDSLLPQSLVERQDHVSVTLNIQLVEINAETGRTKIVKRLASNIANTGRYQVVIPSEYNGVSAAVIQVTIANVQSSDPFTPLLGYLDTIYNQVRGQLAHWSKIIYISGSNVLRDQCEEWYKNEPNGIGDEMLQQLPPCPPTENRMTNIFVKEDYGDAFREFFHPNSSSCYRQNSFIK